MLHTWGTFVPDVAQKGKISFVAIIENSVCSIELYKLANKSTGYNEPLFCAEELFSFHKNSGHNPQIKKRMRHDTQTWPKNAGNPISTYLNFNQD